MRTTLHLMALPPRALPPTRPSTSRGNAAAFALLLLLASSCGGLPGQSTPADLITPSAAEKVVHSYWSVNEQALATFNPDLLTKVQATPLLEAQSASLKAAKAAGDPPLKAPRPLKKLTAYVPHQRHHPAQFVALVETVKIDSSGKPTADPIAYYYRFTEQSNGAPWKADFYVLAPTNAPQQIALDSDGYATALSPGQSGLVLTPEQLPASLARYLETGITTGSAQGPFAPGHLTTDAVKALRDYRDAMDKLGYTVEIGYEADRFVSAYRGSGGRAVVLFDVHSSDKIGVKDALHCIVQPKEDLHRWGGLLPPGSYSHLVEGRQLQFVAADPPNKAGNSVDVPAYVDTQVSAEASPADPACR